jgi:uncharacterized protein YecT (DUF1311 family)
MKPFQIFRVLACACAAALLLGGCALFHSGNQTASSAVPAASFGSSSSAVSQEAAGSSSEAESALSSEASSQTVSEPASSESGPVITIQTDSEAFNAKFKENPIDKAYIAASNKAVSTVDMVSVSNQYSQLWEAEVKHAYSELTMAIATDSSIKPAALRDEQQKWESGKDAALKKIGKDAAATGGSMAQVNEASQRMDFYRSRAAQLYRELYDYNKSFDYAYSAK